ncbi:MAG: hypothetical protein KIT27_04750 [Legionellales bacterium]|nr:hypothetical protein [Legionellales bacterium]
MMMLSNSKETVLTTIANALEETIPTNNIAELASSAFSSTEDSTRLENFTAVDNFMRRWLALIQLSTFGKIDLDYAHLDDANAILSHLKRLWQFGLDTIFKDNLEAILKTMSEKYQGDPKLNDTPVIKNWLGYYYLYSIASASIRHVVTDKLEYADWVTEVNKIIQLYLQEKFLLKENIESGLFADVNQLDDFPDFFQNCVNDAQKKIDLFHIRLSILEEEEQRFTGNGGKDCVIKVTVDNSDQEIAIRVSNSIFSACQIFNNNNDNPLIKVAKAIPIISEKVRKNSEARGSFFNNMKQAFLSNHRMSLVKKNELVNFLLGCLTENSGTTLKKLNELLNNVAIVIENDGRITLSSAKPLERNKRKDSMDILPEIINESMLSPRSRLIHFMSGVSLIHSPSNIQMSDTSPSISSVALICQEDLPTAVPALSLSTELNQPQFISNMLTTLFTSDEYNQLINAELPNWAETREQWQVLEIMKKLTEKSEELFKKRQSLESENQNLQNTASSVCKI